MRRRGGTGRHRSFAAQRAIHRARRRRRILALARLAAHPRLATAPPLHPDLTAADLKMMRRAIMLARRAAKAGEVPVGAVVYQGDRVVAQMANNREATQDPVGHAELLALSEAGRSLGTWRLNDCSMAVTLEPCPMCAGAMVNARLGRLVYGTTDPKAGAVHTLFEIATDSRLNHRVQVIPGVLADECRALLQEFFQQRRAAKRASR